MLFHAPVDPEHIKRERRKAQELRQGSWWKQQIGPGVCHHCDQKFVKEFLTMDHLIPLARGGKTSKSNCVVSCKDCNSARGSQLDVERTLADLEVADPSDGSLI
jgi:5-methylcytosine-specific restriction protein A